MCHFPVGDLYDTSMRPNWRAYKNSIIPKKVLQFSYKFLVGCNFLRISPKVIIFSVDNENFIGGLVILRPISGTSSNINSL